MDRIIRVTTTLQRTGYIIVDVPARKTLDAQARCHFRLRAIEVLLTQHAWHRLHQHKGLHRRPWNPAIDRAVHTMIIQPSRMHVETCGVDIHHRSTEQIHSDFVSNAGVETVETAARLGPVADPNHAFISEIKQLPSGK